MSEKQKYWLLFFAIAISLNLFMFTPYLMLELGKTVVFGLALFLLGLCFFGSARKSEIKMVCKPEMILLIILPFISSISCYYYRGQSISTTILATRTVALLSIYFVLHKYKYSYDTVLKVVLRVSYIVTAIYILQQILYPSVYLFGQPITLDNPVEIRNGFYRFRLHSLIPFVYIGFYYMLNKWLQKRHNKHSKKILISLFLFAFAIYLTLTRQIWVCVLLPALFYNVLKDSKITGTKIAYIISGIVILYIIYINIDIFVGKDLIQRSHAENTDDNIRLLAMNFYGIEYWEDKTNMIFGNGYPSWGNSEYGNYMEFIETERKLYRSDIGIIGLFNIYGIVYVSALILLYVKLFKHFVYLSGPIRMLVLASFLNLPLACWTDFQILWAIIIYLADLDINRNKYSITT